MSWASCCWAWN